MIQPEEVAGTLDELKPYMAEVCEVMLADWQDNPNSGAWVKFRLPDETHLEIYRGKYRAGRTKGFGQRYRMILIEINDDEAPMTPEADETPRPRKLSQIAGALCNNPVFRAWAADAYGDPVPDADAAAQLVRDICGIESRRELDTNEEAAKLFRGVLEEFDKAPKGESGNPA